LFALGAALLTAPAMADDNHEPILKGLSKHYAKLWGCDSVVAGVIPDSAEPYGGRMSWGYEVTGCDAITFVGAPSKVVNSWIEDSKLRKRVQLEWSCEKADVTLVYIDRKTRVVKGCDEQATYVWVNYSWVANTVRSD